MVLSASRTNPVVIAGGGIGGLATALALARAGQPCVVVERRRDATEVGAGIQIGPNGVKILRALGVAERLASLAGRPDEIVVRNARTGAVTVRMPLGDWIERRHGAPYWVIHRSDLHSALLATARASSHIEIRTGQECVGIDAHADGVVVAVVSPSGDASRIEASALIGADGVGSTVRRLIATKREAKVRPTARMSGTVAARATFATPLSGTMAEPVVTVWMSAHSHVVHYPVHQGREVSAVAFVASSDPLRERPQSGRELATRVRAAAPELEAALAAVEKWDKWPIVGWNNPEYAVDRCTALLGDAAHPLRPYLAQGAVMAMEDAMVLSAELRNTTDTTAALTAYAARRHPRVRRVAASSFLNGVAYHMPAPVSAVRDAALARLGGERLIASFDWLYGADISRIER
jgi:salicylate hydroxylase